MQEYILPDFSSNRQGKIKEPNDIVSDTDQILVMNNERFSIPETIFRPDDIGMPPFPCISTFDYISVLYTGLDQSGLAGTVAASISALPEDLKGMFWANIGLIGGSTKFPGFQQRLYVLLLIGSQPTMKIHSLIRMAELRPLAPVDFDVMIYQCDE